MAPPDSSTRGAHPLPDEAARQRIRSDLGATLIVEAAAGTGKTTMLVSRILAVLRTGLTELDRIVAVTFTEKAAGEMKLRLRAAIEAERKVATPQERTRLDKALAHLEVARIGTIHSFCGDLLRERPVEARVDPLFEVMAEDEAERLFSQCFDAWFEVALADPPEGVRRILRRRAGGRERSGPRATLREAAWKLCSHRDFAAPYRRDPFDRDAALDALVQDLARLAPYADLADQPESDWLAKGIARVARFLAELERREKVRLHDLPGRAPEGSPGPNGRDYDGLEAEMASLARARDWTWKGYGAYGKGLPRATVLAERDQAKARLDAFLEKSDADLAACLQRELSPIADRYAALKARAGKLDFLDLLLSTRDLVKGRLDVRAELATRFTHLFVDEFQDTDPLQAELLLLLAAKDPRAESWATAEPVPGKLFLVGDPKQSIYRFRRADVELYEQIKDRLLEQGASLLYLTTSFRAAPAIQEAVNAAFSRAMAPPRDGPRSKPARRASQARYVALEKHRDEVHDQPAVVVLPVPRPYGQYGKVTEYAIRDSLPDAVGAFVDWLVNKSRWRVTEREGPDHRAPIEPRHICLLFKRFQSFGEDVTRAYVRALEARRIPHVLVGGRSFFDREEVQAVRNLLTAIEWPDDELSVYATLRGPFFALADDALLAYRHAVGSGQDLGPLHPLRAPDAPPASLADDDGAVSSVLAALAILRAGHAGRNRRPIADTLGRVLESTRAHAGVAIWPTGEQALANVLRVMDLARRFEGGGATSFRAFLSHLDDLAESGAAGEAPVVEEGTEGVRIMTVHKAKGLEFPVVILCDPTAPASAAQPSRHVDQETGLWAEAIAGCVPRELADHREEVLALDREESVRVGYVASTRARDLLVCPAVGDERVDGWLDILDPILRPDELDRRSPLPAPGCPPFGSDSVLERPEGCRRNPDDSIAPGLHFPVPDGPPVVWWDPRALDLDKAPGGGLRQQSILAADEGVGQGSRVSELAHEAWFEARASLLRDGKKKSLPVRTVTELAKGTPEAPPAAWAAEMNDARDEGDAGGLPAHLTVELADTGAAKVGRPRGKRFGVLVHAVLAEVGLDDGHGLIDAAARVQGRSIGASPEEVLAAAAAVKTAVCHPILRRAAESAKRGECRREAPVLLPGSGGEIIEGVVDLAFREGSEWIVVDFKTDAEIAGRLAAYRTQILLYVEAIRAATGEAARGVLLSV